MSDRPSTGAEPESRTTAVLRRCLPGAADLRNHHRRRLRPDLLAVLAVWAVLVPQGLAYGGLAGLSPVTGLYTALGAVVLCAAVAHDERRAGTEPVAFGPCRCDPDGHCGDVAVAGGEVSPELHEAVPLRGEEG